MRIEKLVLENFRSAHSLKLNLQDNLIVLVGINGAGKTTILDAIAILLSWLVSRTLNIKSTGKRIQEDDITNGKSFSKLEILCTDKERVIKWSLVKSKEGHLKSDVDSSLSDVNWFVQTKQKQITNTAEKTNLPLYVYYPIDRGVGEIPLRVSDKHKFRLLDAYDKSLDSGTQFKAFFEWFRKREDLENELRRHQFSLFEEIRAEYPDPQLEAVRNAVYAFLPNCSNLAVYRSPLRMELIKNGKPLRVNQLSDGEKGILAIVGDLARRMAIANPNRKNPLEGEGIVLIDEIDLHLHPKWQRMIVSRLISVFPNCQFIVSTHSPNVINQVQPENLILLEQDEKGLKYRQVGECYGMSIERVVKLIMDDDSRPFTVIDKLDNLFELIERKKLDEAKELISSMKKYMRRDPEIMRAEMLIRQEEIST